MEPISDFQAKIQDIAKMLPPEKLREVIDYLKGMPQAKAVF